MGNLRYFDRTKDSVNYRTFVEGFQCSVMI